MYRQKLKQKAFTLLVMVVFLVALIVRSTDKTKEERVTEEGEELVIPKEETHEETLIPQAVWEMPGADTTIRVLLLNDSGSVYHKEKELPEEYPGELQYYEEEQGWVIVNELPLEEYLRWVVPSEMPSTYAQEALKAQAVCARTYAVWQMQDYAYPEYEAHVDDSVSYQVYHNIDSQQSTDQAVTDTKGQIMLYDGVPVKAYYFATSSGNTTDENIWEKGDRNVTPYIAGRIVGDSENSRDFSIEENFERFIQKKRSGDLEIGEPWYRWNTYISLAQIEKNVKNWIRIRAARTEDGILLQKDENYVWPDVDAIGVIQSAEIIERNTGGAAHQMILKGEDGVLKIKYEYNIRLMLGVPGGRICKNDGTIGEGGNLLPSGYFILEPVKEDGILVGYEVIGGGLGHGAGMSQNGARILAEQGKNYEEILQYFYKDICLARME
ncbi:MAG: SpoIID/LytB domain-containing protein [Lachnospiraceae bacterium]|nr:SpoIID/LytB domain-containing protein [Lachnospiraceae bacterium]